MAILTGIFEIADNALTRELGISKEAIAHEMATSPEVHAGVERLAIEVRDYWRSLAPVFSPETSHRDEPPNGEEPGAYRDSIHEEWRHDRGELPAMQVLSDDLKSKWIEYGAEHMPEFACATRTAAHFGGSGPISDDERIMSKQEGVREAVSALAAARRGGSHEDISLAKKQLERARMSRSAAFKARRTRDYRGTTAYRSRKHGRSR